MSGTIRTAGYRKAGEVQGDVFSKDARRGEHFLRTPPAIGWAEAALAEAARRGVQLLHVYTTDERAHYWVRLDVARRHGFVQRRGGWEPQRFVPLGLWRATRAEAEAFAPVPRAAPDAQERLF